MSVKGFFEKLLIISLCWLSCAVENAGQNRRSSSLSKAGKAVICLLLLNQWKSVIQPELWFFSPDGRYFLKGFDLAQSRKVMCDLHFKVARKTK